jgi:hypothetical protein
VPGQQHGSGRPRCRSSRPQRGGIDVTALLPHPEVDEATCHADRRAPGDRSPHLDQHGRQSGHARSESVRVHDAHHQPTGDLSGEGDDAGTDRADVLALDRSVLDAPVAGGEGTGRRSEGVRHGPGDRRRIPAKPWGSGVARRSCRATTSRRCCGRARLPTEEQPDEQPEHDRADQPTGRTAQSSSRLPNRERRWRTALVWIWQTRDSVTPRTRPISCSVRLS